MPRLHFSGRLTLPRSLPRALAVGLFALSWAISSPPAHAQDANCQRLSDTYGIVHGISFGDAPAGVRDTWTRYGCNTRPSEYGAMQVCQRLADTWGINRPSTWGSAPPIVQTAFNELRCTASVTAADWLTNLAIGQHVRNISMGRPVRESSSVFGSVPSRATDGRLSGAFGDGTLTHTNAVVGEWLEVDLLYPQSVSLVKVYNRTDCCSGRLNGVKVELRDTPCDRLGPVVAQSNPIANAGAVVDVPFQDQRARYVCLRHTRPDHLAVAEVSVLRRDTMVSDNHVRGATARQSSTFGGAAASRAVDGNRDGDFNRGSVSHTEGRGNEWLDVDLGTYKPIQTVILFNRSDSNSDRLDGAVVELSNLPCDAPNRGIAASAPVPFELGPAVRRVEFPSALMVQRICVRQPRAVHLQLAELEAYGSLDTGPRAPATARASTIGYGTVPQSMIDGVTVGTFAAGSISISAGGTINTSAGLINDEPVDSAPWFEVDLGHEQRVGEVVVHNRTDCCGERLAGARLELSLDPCDNPIRRIVRDEAVPIVDQTIKPPLGGPGLHNGSLRSAMTFQIVGGHVAPAVSGLVPARVSFPFLERPTARYVCVRHDAREFLQVSEIEVFVAAAIHLATDVKLVNLALNGEARQSSTGWGGTADRAIDGITDGNFDGGTTTHTDERDKTPWLEVDLGEVQKVHALVVHNRVDGSSERLLDAKVELTLDPCDSNTRRVVFRDVIGKASARNHNLLKKPIASNPFESASKRWERVLKAFPVIVPVPERRTEFSLLLPVEARYACLRTLVTAPGSPGPFLHVAELEVFGVASGPLPAPAPVSASIAQAEALVPTPVPAPAASVQAPPDATATGATWTIGVRYAGFSAPSCQVTSLGSGRFTINCAGVSMTMTGQVASATNYDLVSEGTFSLADLLKGPLFTSSLAGLTDAIAPLLPVRDLKLGLSHANGFYVRGLFDFADLANTAGGPIKTGLGAFQSLLASYIPGYQKTPRFELIPVLTQQTATLTLKVFVLEGCSDALTLLSEVGSKIRFNASALVATLGLVNGVPTIGGGLEGHAYLKPSGQDDWLHFMPGIDLAAAATGASLSVRGRVSGACPTSCVDACGCTATQCSTPWSPLGLSALAIENGYIELGGSLSVPPAPIIKLAFDRIRIGSKTSPALDGSVLVAFDYPSRIFGLQLSAQKLPLLGLLGIIGSNVGLDRFFPSELAIDQPRLSYASSDINLFGSTVPGGLRIAGGVNLPSIGLQGRVDLTHTGSGGSLSLEQLGTKSLTQMLPLGTFRFMIDIADLPKKILGSNVLGELAQAALRSTFYLKRLELGVGLGTTTFVEVNTRFTIFGSNQNFDFRLGASLSDVSSIVVPLANRIADLAGNLLAEAYRIVSENVAKAITETAAFFKAGGTAVIDGVVTVGSQLVNAVGQGLSAIESGAKKGWKKFKSFIGL